jgi:hypothetical protein
MKPIWENYKNWECYKNKMYDNSYNKENIKLCKIILTNENLKNNMSETTKQYKVSTKVNLTNKMFNPISWLGQATCNRLIGASAKETCQAWLTMSGDEQKRANKIAKEVIEEWRKNNENI